MACLVRQSLSGQAPVYLADDCCLVSDSTRRSLRSADVQTCVVPRTYSSYGDRTFAAAGPRLWNSLPVQLLNTDTSYGLLRRQLRGYFFGNHGHGDLWLLICSALEKHLLTYTAKSGTIIWYHKKWPTVFWSVRHAIWHWCFLVPDYGCDLNMFCSLQEHSGITVWSVLWTCFFYAILLNSVINDYYHFFYFC